ncbi:phosphotransferase [Streptomyces sp. NPDC045431]|uniref:maltokinase N-terminal cap-like domain-containing protein n=1 Tax=Streptomyces sp. NPDC045431 TaxID=3155613 RepID=UPI0033CDFD67
MTVDMGTLQLRLERALTAWVPWQRWYGSKGRPPHGASIVGTTAFSDTLRTGGARGVLLLLRVTFADGGPPEYYQVPVGMRAVLALELEPYVIAGVDDLFVYEAVGDSALVGALLGLTGARSVPPGTSRPLGVEQTHTSVVVDERYLLKIFRRISTGTNPDVELLRALGATANPHVTGLRGAVEGELDGEPVTYAMVQDYLPEATDGFTAACAAVAACAAASTGAATSTGTSASTGAAHQGAFVPEARAMGEAVARVHADLARRLGTAPTGAAELAALRRDLAADLDEAARRVPALRPLRPAVRAAYERLAVLASGPPAQRVHGDLHLGQLLRSSTGWILVDFEGAPGVPLAERRARHSPLSDIAGMLRSFDYAARCAGVPDTGRWTARCADAFCDGYARVSGLDPREHTLLLRACVLARAVHEVVYEHDHRPERTSLPLAAVAELAQHGHLNSGNQAW